MIIKKRKKRVKSLGTAAILVASTAIGTVAQACAGMTQQTPIVSNKLIVVNDAVNALYNYDNASSNAPDTLLLIDGILIHFQTINPQIIEIQSISFQQNSVMSELIEGTEGNYRSLISGRVLVIATSSDASEPLLFQGDNVIISNIQLDNEHISQPSSEGYQIENLNVIERVFFSHFLEESIPSNYLSTTSITNNSLSTTTIESYERNNNDYINNGFAEIGVTFTDTDGTTFDDHVLVSTPNNSTDNLSQAIVLTEPFGDGNIAYTKYQLNAWRNNTFTGWISADTTYTFPDNAFNTAIDNSISNLTRRHAFAHSLTISALLGNGLSGPGIDSTDSLGNFNLQYAASFSANTNDTTRSKSLASKVANSKTLDEGGRIRPSVGLIQESTSWIQNFVNSSAEEIAVQLIRLLNIYSTRDIILDLETDPATLNNAANLALATTFGNAVRMVKDIPFYSDLKIELVYGFFNNYTPWVQALIAAIDIPVTEEVVVKFEFFLYLNTATGTLANIMATPHTDLINIVRAIYGNEVSSVSNEEIFRFYAGFNIQAVRADETNAPSLYTPQRAFEWTTDYFKPRQYNTVGYFATSGDNAGGLNIAGAITFGVEIAMEQAVLDNNGRFVTNEINFN